MSFSDINDKVDIELLIGEVKNYKELWNIADESYHDQTKKRSAWINICRVFCSSFDDKKNKEKNIIYKNIIKKWRNIKDNYTKCETKKTKSGQGANFGRRYIYARQLSFLQTAGATTETQTSLNDTSEQDDLEQENLDSEKQPTNKADRLPQYTQNTSTKRKQDIKSSLIDFLNAPIPAQTIQTSAPEPNLDRLFFESILPFITNFTEDQKLEFRCEVLNIIKRLRTAPSHNYGYQPSIQYNAPGYPTSELSNYSPQTTNRHSKHLSPILNISNYKQRPQFQQFPPRYSQFRPSSAHFPQTRYARQYFNPISPGTSSTSSAGNNKNVNEENTLEVISDTE